jgi:hypothetical protein
MNPGLQASWKKHFNVLHVREKAESAKHATDVSTAPVLSDSFQLATESVDVDSPA